MTYAEIFKLFVFKGLISYSGQDGGRILNRQNYFNSAFFYDFQLIKCHKTHKGKRLYKI